MLRRLLRQNPLENIDKKSGAETKSLRDAGGLAFLQISSGLVEHRELPSILNLIVQESLNCLKAHRSTIFLMEGKSGILKTQSTHVPDPRDVQVEVFEEKEVARKVIRQKKPFLLREPNDFSEFFKYEERERKITSLMGVPLLSQRKTIGALSMVMIDGDRHFNEEDLKLLSIFGNHASIAIEMAYLSEEVEKAFSSHKAYEGYLENIMDQLQRLSEEERQRIGEHIEKLDPDSMPEEYVPSELQQDQGKGEETGLTFMGELGSILGQDEKGDGMLRVELADSSSGFVDDLTATGLFIRTPNPLELGEQFLLKLHIPDGGKPVEVGCKVIWTNKYGKESRDLRRGMGVKFLNPQPQIQRRIEDSIKWRQPRNGGDILAEREDANQKTRREKFPGTADKGPIRRTS